ncbi:hypothetical protein DH2020_002790 [Rehmannia glutinosa]|uniref:Uncharacterized protein n=1 Tax=Rehmannia glutinosa TaxID=99300 RepID=A0ABR0XUU2_REHGL
MKDNFWVVESSEKPSVGMKRKRRIGKRKIEFIGWGSRPLIEFLEAIGQDTREKCSQREVAAFITKYINDNGLASAEKKKKVLCDERLHALFGKKTVSRIKVYDMLEEHFAENHDSSDDELDSSDEEDYGKNISLGLKNDPTGRMKKVPKTPKSCFAAVIPENIKLVYLKRSLIQELLKVPESFECKMVGSFVRMKSDPNDIYQKNRFQLQQVTGVQKISGAGDAGIEICLRVANYFKEIPICMLSDDNFSEEEIEDVRDRIKAGLLKRLTVKELEVKAQILHADITKHYLDRRKMLQTPSEQEKLLLKIPEVIAEELEPEVTVTAASETAEGSGSSPKSILRGTSDVSSTDASGSGGIAAPSQVAFSDSHALEARSGGIDGIVPVKNPNGDQAADIQIQQRTLVADVICDEGSSETPQIVNSGENDPKEKPEQQPASVIDLSDDESEDEVPKDNGQFTGECPNDAIWHYVDPHGQTRGPFSLYLLKRWSDANYFHSGFRVWKSDQTSDDGVLLVDVLSRSFPN